MSPAPGPLQGLQGPQQAVEARHPGVVNPEDPAAQGLGGEGRLLAHCQIAGARADHGHGPGEGVLCGVRHRQAGIGAVVIGKLPPQQGFLLRREPGDEDVGPAPLHHGADDALDLRRGLALAEDDLRRPLAGGAVVVHLGIAQVLIGLFAQDPGGFRRRGLAGGDFFQ